MGPQGKKSGFPHERASGIWQNGQNVFALSVAEAVFPSALLVPAVPTHSGTGRDKTCLSACWMLCCGRSCSSAL